jgi:hypothetical protein
MARTTGQPSTATRRNTSTTRSNTGGPDSLNGRDKDSNLHNDERHEGLSAVRKDRDDDRHNSRDERNDSNRSNEDGARHEQGPANLTAGMDTFAPVLDAWKQVFKSWSELTETMVKAQQDAFASMFSDVNTHAKTLDLGKNRNGENRNSERAFAPTASTSETIDRDRR